MEEGRGRDGLSPIARAAVPVLLGSGLVLSAVGGWVLLDVLEHLPTCSGHSCQLSFIFLGIGIGLSLLGIGNIVACIGMVRGCWAGEYLGWLVGPIGLLISVALVWVWLEYVV